LGLVSYKNVSLVFGGLAQRRCGSWDRQVSMVRKKWRSSPMITMSDWLWLRRNGFRPELPRRGRKSRRFARRRWPLVRAT